MPAEWASPTAFTTRRTTAARYASASRTIRRPSPHIPSLRGGNARSHTAIVTVPSFWSWRTPVAVTAVSWAWKTEIQTQLCNPFGITATIAHYPTGASKWNPIEHRLFSEISKHWAAEPLVSYDKMLGFIRSTTTKTGLVVTAYLDRTEYPIGLKPDRRLISSLALKPRQTSTAMELHHRA
jgi:hypothetical protein